VIFGLTAAAVSAKYILAGGAGCVARSVAGLENLPWAASTSYLFTFPRRQAAKPSAATRWHGSRCTLTDPGLSNC
jgi:hypothetical protein